MNIYVVGQIKGEWKSTEEGGCSWEFQGVFDDEKKAIDACRDRTYFIIPTELNKSYPHETIELTEEECYYPKAN